MRRIQSLEDVQLVLNELLNWKLQLESRALDLRKRQIKNVGEATDDSDVPTLAQVKRLIADAGGS